MPTIPVRHLPQSESKLSSFGASSASYRSAAAHSPHIVMLVLRGKCAGLSTFFFRGKGKRVCIALRPPHGSVSPGETLQLGRIVPFSGSELSHQARCRHLGARRAGGNRLTRPASAPASNASTHIDEHWLVPEEVKLRTVR